MRAKFASAGLTAGQLNAIVKKLGGHDAALRFLRGEISASEPTRSWREEDDVIYFSLTSDGSTGEDWITRLEGKGFRMTDSTKEVLRSPDFKPTNGVTTEVAVLKGLLFEEDDDRITKNIRAEAFKRELHKPNAELACLIREKFADEEIKTMGLHYIVAMHESINDSRGVPYLLHTSCNDGGRRFDAKGIHSGQHWFRGFGFAFAVSRVSPQS
ncbi:MAG: hypothetical protein WC787_04855 [Patescibacteria group bacterium]|jgi:hypothetical protein